MVLTGTGVYGAAGAGVLAALLQRGIEPYAVCGMGTGAWPSAVYAAGADAEQLWAAAMQAQRMGKRMLGMRCRAREMAIGRRHALFEADGIEHLLGAQTGSRVLALCKRTAVFPVISARTGQKMLFSTRAFEPADDAMLTMQATSAFAARAAMGTPPFLAPLTWMGAAIVPAVDVWAGARQLFALGAHRVLIAVCRPSPRSAPDALDLTSIALEQGMAQGLEQGIAGTGVLRIQLPEGVHALSLDAVMDCAQAGKKTAERELDHLLSCMGMASCRILPFQRG